MEDSDNEDEIQALEAQIAALEKQFSEAKQADKAPPPPPPQAEDSEKLSISLTRRTTPAPVARVCTNGMLN